MNENKYRRTNSGDGLSWDFDSAAGGPRSPFPVTVWPLVGRGKLHNLGCKIEKRETFLALGKEKNRGLTRPFLAFCLCCLIPSYFVRLTDFPFFPRWPTKRNRERERERRSRNATPYGLLSGHFIPVLGNSGCFRRAVQMRGSAELKKFEPKLS